jgi:pyruvate/2-oxoglutarate dehydrogenase complex dihydrolipoamide dehydrogenase (E3) component
MTTEDIRTYDVIVIGAGPVGENVADRATAAGLSTVIIERELVDRDRQVVVGARFAGPGVAELLHSATVAVTGEVPVDRLWHAVPAFPTISEVWLRLLEKRRDS